MPECGSSGCDAEATTTINWWQDEYKESYCDRCAEEIQSQWAQITEVVG